MCVGLAHLVLWKWFIVLFLTEFTSPHIINSFMQSIYTYISETNDVHREYSVAAILLLLFMVLISLVPVLNLLYFYISYFLKYVCGAQYGCFLSFLDFVFSWYVAHVFSK